MHAIIKQAVPRIEVRAAGLNHFTCVDVHDRRTGEDLYRCCANACAPPPDFEPLRSASSTSSASCPYPATNIFANTCPG